VAASLADVPVQSSIVLFTAGASDACEADQPRCGFDDTFEALQAAQAMRIRTFVVEVGRGPDEYFFKSAANAGVGDGVEKPPMGLLDRCNLSQGALRARYRGNGGRAPYFRADEPAPLAEVIAQLFASFVP